MWRNGENGAMPWEYQGYPWNSDRQPYADDFDTSIFVMAYPTWSGKPIDTVHFEAFREGIYDTRYLATV